MITEYEKNSAVSELKKEAEFDDAVSCVLGDYRVREVVGKFAGKVVNKRLFSALTEAAKIAVPDASFGIDEFCGHTYLRVYLVPNGRAGYRYATIWGRYCDWTKCDPEDRVEVSVAKGVRLSAKLADVFRYEANIYHNEAVAIRDFVKNIDTVVSEINSRLGELGESLGKIPGVARSFLKVDRIFSECR